MTKLRNIRFCFIRSKKKEEVANEITEKAK